MVTAEGIPIKIATKTSKKCKNISLMEVSGKGYRLYLDALHLDHIEVFDRYGNIKAVLNLDGTFNYKKFHLALKEGRRI